MIIEKQHHEYLFLQRGDISHETNLEKWKRLYADALHAQVQTISGCVGSASGKKSPSHGRVESPSAPFEVLDIGAGLGGIHQFLLQLVPHPYRLTILDGLNDPPEHKNSFTTFSNAAVAKDFLAKNGVMDTHFIDTFNGLPPKKFDLVVSFAAYGFHIHPGNYLEDLKKYVDDATVLVFDVRRSKREWLRELVAAFGPPKVLHTAEKYVRLAFHD